MEVKCPKCLMSVPVKEGRELACPNCRAALEVIEAEAGFNIIGARKDQNAPQGALFANDPVIEYYTKWQMRALFAVALGIAIGFMLFLDMKNSYFNFGFYFWKNPRNMIFPYIGAPLTLLLIAGGIWLYRYADKDKKRYVDGKYNHNQEDR
jgi:hypothetical protein